MADSPTSSWQVKASVCETPTGTSVWVEVADACGTPVSNVVVALGALDYTSADGDTYVSSAGDTYAASTS